MFLIQHLFWTQNTGSPALAQYIILAATLRPCKHRYTQRQLQNLETGSHEVLYLVGIITVSNYKNLYKLSEVMELKNYAILPCICN